jgi:TRAP-type mannitol/chloroaromatic compound transport system permease small subunit
VKALLGFSRLVDAFNERVGRLVSWLILAAVVISAGNATIRYSLDMSSNAWLELQWYLFAAVFLLCSGYTLQRNEHIRIDVLFGHYSKRTQAWIDLLGTLFFLLPMAIIILDLSIPVFVNAWQSGEVSGNAGGLIRWPARILVPIGFTLLVLQGLAEAIKRAAYLAGYIEDPGTQAHAHGGELDDVVKIAEGKE